MRLILVRHGNTFDADQTPTMVGARSDLPLTKEGSEQAIRLASRFTLENIIPRAIYAGSLKRQMQTAEIVREHLQFESSIRIESGLTEIDYGLWEGQSQEELQKKWPQELHDWSEKGKWPANVFGRSREDHLLDIQNWLAHLRASYVSGDQIIAVTSNGILRFFNSTKVKTGHFCEIDLLLDSIHIQRWNVQP